MKPLPTIVIFHPHFTIAGGAGNFVFEVGTRLAKRGYKIVIITIRADPNLVAQYKSDITFLELGGPLSSSLKFWLTFPYVVFKAVKACDGCNPNLIFPQVFPANWWGFIYKFLRPNIKSIWMCQEPSAFIHSKAWISSIRDPLMYFLLRVFNPILKFLDCGLASNVDFVFTNSNYGAKYAAEVYKYSLKKLQPLYLGVNSAFNLGDSTPSFHSRRSQIITVCRLTKFKNVSLIIKALAILIRSGFAEIQLKIVGSGEEQSKLRELVHDLKLENSVTFCGALSQTELILELALSKAFILASVNEPFGLAVVEALACGTPAVVVNSGGPAEIVENDRSGYYFEANNADALASKIMVLLEQQADFDRLSSGAKQRSAQFNWDLTTDKLEAKIRLLLHPQ